MLKQRTYQKNSHPNLEMTRAATELLNALGKYYVAYYKVLADLTGSPKAALMLGHAMVMTRVVMEKQSHRKGGHEGWFYKTAYDWKKITGLTVREIESARSILVDDGILHERRQGMPAKLWFRVDLDRLAYRLCEFTNTEYRAWSWEDRVLKALLGKPILFYVPFAWIADSALAGLYMSTLLAKLLKVISQNEVMQDGWFNSTIHQSIEQLNFGRHALMNAREKLIEANMIEEIREKRAKSRLLSRINLADLPDIIALEASKYHSMSKNDNQVCRKTTYYSSPKRETRVHQNAKQQFTETQNKSSPKRETCFAVSETLITRANSVFNTTYQHPHNEIASVKSDNVLEVVDFSNLIYPDNLLPAERGEAIKLISSRQFSRCRHQLVLDEWHGQILKGNVKLNQLGYLRVLMQKESEGILVVEVGHQIQARRIQRQQQLEERSKPKPIVTPKTPEMKAAQHHKFMELRKSLGWK